MKEETPNTVSSRLEEVRKARGYATLRDFHRALTASGEYSISYEAVRNYHYDRTPPLEYVVAVSRRFGESLDWIASGEGGTYEETSFSTPPHVMAEHHRGRQVNHYLMMEVHQGIYRQVDTFVHRALDEAPTCEAAIAHLSFLVFRHVRYHESLAAGAPRMGAPAPERDAYARSLRLTVEDLAEKMREAGSAIGRAITAPYEALPFYSAKPSIRDRIRYVTLMLLAIEQLMESAWSDTQKAGLPPITPKYAWRGAEFSPLRRIVEEMYENVFHTGEGADVRRGAGEVNTSPDMLVDPPGEIVKHAPHPGWQDVESYTFVEVDPNASPERQHAQRQYNELLRERHKVALREWDAAHHEQQERG